MSMTVDGKEALEALFWRAEILQALYWMRGEGLADAVDPARLAEFLLVDRDIVDLQMRDLVADGYLNSDSERYTLTALGVEEGGRSFQDDFGDLTRPAHYECGPGCWCQDPDHVGEPCPSHPLPTPPPDPEPSDPAPDD
jgi:hypothetical protein